MDNKWSKIIIRQSGIISEIGWEMMRRVIYWIREYITNKKNCRGFCPTCEYYGICREDEGESLSTGNSGISGTTGEEKETLQIHNSGDCRGCETHRFISIEEEKTMDNKLMELDDYIKVEQILLEEELRRAAFMDEFLGKGEAA